MLPGDERSTDLPEIPVLDDLCIICAEVIDLSDPRIKPKMRSR
jgi:hypothetical protein